VSTPPDLPPEPQEPAFEPNLTDRLRSADFSTVMRGYDKAEVDALLASVAESIERMQTGVGTLEDDDGGTLKRELERVGEQTKHILTAAEETAQQLRSEAAAKAAETRKAAETWANRVRGDAEEFANTTRARVEEEARRARLDAGRKAAEIVTAAEARAEEVVDATAHNRRRLEARIEALEERREAILADARSLLDELAVTLSAHERGVEETEDEQADQGPVLEDEAVVAPEPAEPFEHEIYAEGDEEGAFRIETPAEPDRDLVFDQESRPAEIGEEAESSEEFEIDETAVQPAAEAEEPEVAEEAEETEAPQEAEDAGDDEGTAEQRAG
jgi:DivIVA domain-containing protein